MASPFRIFRKHQKVMIATLAILAMGAFVFLDPLMQLLGGGGGGPEASNEVVIRWDDGEVRQWDLERMVQMRNIVNYFVSAASQLGSMASGAEMPSFPGFGPASEQHVVRTMLLARAARDFGFVVSDEVINGFLREITRESVPETRLRDIIARSSVGNRRVSMEMVFQALREELLAQQLINNYMMSADSVLPSERWMTWLRINDRVTVATLPVPVEDFLDRVEDPSPEELQTFFEAYKDVVQRPEIVDAVQLASPDPGFKQPRQVTLQYVRADYDSFVDRLAQQVSDEEIEDFYQRNKRRFVVPDLLEDDATPDQTETDTAPTDADAPEPVGTDAASESAADRAPPTEPQPGDHSPPDAPPARPKAEAPPDESPPPAQQTDTTPATSPPSEPSADQPDEVDADEPPGEPATPERDNDAEAAGADSRAEESEQEASDGEPEETGRPEQESESGSEDESPVDPAPASDTGKDGAPGEVPDSSPAETSEGQAPVNPDETPPAEPASAPGQDSQATDDGAAEAPSDVSLSAESESDRQQAPADDAADSGEATIPPASSEAPTTQPEPSEEPPRYAPLEEVRDEIRRDLARQRAPEAMQQVLSGWVSEMKGYYRKLQVWELQPESEDGPSKEATRPEPPDAGTWAEQQGVVFEKTAPLSSFELQDMDLGRSMIVREGETLLSRAFTQMPAYQPVVTEDIMGNRYVVWKTSESAEKVPSLSDVRPDVVRAWKMRQARELARKKAEELADQARQSGKPLGEVFPEEDRYQVTRSDPFSWLTLGAVPGGRDVRLRLSEIYGVSQAGRAFMQTVFSLSEGEVAVAMNHPQDTAYVVQLAERERSREALREDFMKEAEVYVPVVQRQNRLAAMAGLVGHLSEAYDVEGWERLEGSAQTR